jgi:hypothetical protein
MILSRYLRIKIGSSFLNLCIFMICIFISTAGRYFFLCMPCTAYKINTPSENKKYIIYINAMFEIPMWIHFI